jgi:biofilm PGA synthesis protein PgaD
MKTPLVIDRPDLQAWQQKAVFGLMTAAFWAAWFFLWLPLVTLLAWLFFGYQFQFHMITLRGYEGFMDLLLVYALVIIAMGGALIVWALYNHYRFRGVDRRRPPSPPSDIQLGELLHLPPEVFAEWRQHAIVTVHHDDHGGIARVDTAAPAQAATAART